MKLLISCNIAVIIAIAILSFSCSSYECRINSDTSWMGFVGSTTYSGENNKIISMSEGEEAAFHKTSSSGRLTVKIVKTGIFSESIIDEGSTSESYGGVDIGR